MKIIENIRKNNGGAPRPSLIKASQVQPRSKFLLTTPPQGVENEAEFFKKYKNSAVEYLYGGFSMYFPGFCLENQGGFVDFSWVPGFWGENQGGVWYGGGFLFRGGGRFCLWDPWDGARPPRLRSKNFKRTP